ncbi:MAG TPA: cupin domain-containing protein [Candidatus Heimdallarchaeota archaeon]|nr:cupin domain-containing protein [Candidatus Heimdallarchaeota archaeon]
MQKLGKGVRELRQRHGWTLKDLSSRCGLSESFLSQVERGLASPSLVSLRAIYEALGVELPEGFHISDVLQPTSEKLVMKVGEQMCIRIPDIPVSYKYLSASFPNRELEAVVNSFPPNYKHPISSHPGEEFGFVLDGELILDLNDTKNYLSEGDSYQLPPRFPHGYGTTGKGSATLLIVTGEVLIDVDHTKFPRYVTKKRE